MNNSGSDFNNGQYEPRQYPNFPPQRPEKNHRALIIICVTVVTLFIIGTIASAFKTDSDSSTTPVAPVSSALVTKIPSLTPTPTPTPTPTVTPTPTPKPTPTPTVVPDTSPQTSRELYLSVIREKPFFDQFTDDQMVMLAHSACSDFQQGTTVLYEIGVAIKNGWPAYPSGWFIGAAGASFCPTAYVNAGGQTGAGESF